MFESNVTTPDTESPNSKYPEVSDSEDTGTSVNVTLERSLSFDPKILQRTPSIHSTRSNKSLLQHSLSVPSEEPISETGERGVDMTVDSSVDASISNACESSPNPDEENRIANIGGCIECVKAIPVYHPEELEVGDHIVFAGSVYDHHGIIVGKLSDDLFKIVEATNTLSGAVLGVSKFFGGKAKICSSEKQFNFKTENIRVVEYRKRLYSKEDVAKRAIEYEQGTKDKSEAFKYDLFENNCEHFATYCVTGQKFSIQVRKFRLTAGLFLSNGFIGISDEQKRNDKEFENNIICKECHDMNKRLLEVNLRPIRKETDVEKGDIIRYTYYNLWHEAVVLEVEERKQKFVACRVAHYAFCGFFFTKNYNRRKIENSL